MKGGSSAGKGTDKSNGVGKSTGSTGRGKLAEIQRENAECITLMKTFCLNPARAVYERVDKCGAVTRSEFYATWKVFLPYYCAELETVRNVEDDKGIASESTKGAEGAEGAKGEDTQKKMTLYNMKRDIAFRALILKASEAPTKGTAMQLLYVFAATGWFPAIEKFYECMGDGRINMNTRVELSQEYKTWKELYLARIHELLSADPAHFTSRGIDKTAVDFSRFEVYQREYEAKKKAEREGK
jgi:hypothetical protein